jgi:hypothetical protein
VDKTYGIYRIQRMDGKPLRLALFTDLHIDGRGMLSSAVTRHYLRGNIRALQPDLVALLGDSALCRNNGRRTRGMVELLDKSGVPWTAVLGNHEGENDKTIQRRDVLECYGASSLFVGKTELPGVSGFGNQLIEVCNAVGKPVQLLYFMDSGGARSHSGIQADQIAWYKHTVRVMETLYGRVPSMIFMHIPVHGYQAALDALQAGEARLLRGECREPVCLSGSKEQSDALEAAAREYGSTWAFVCGHDHSNDFCIEHKGLQYIYAQSGGYSARCYDCRSRGVRGSTVFAFDGDGGVTVEQNRNKW